MQPLDVLLKCITLLHREKELGNGDVDSSGDLVRNVLNAQKDIKTVQLIGGESVILEDLKSLLIKMVENPEHYDKITLLESLNLILKDKKAIAGTIDKQLNSELNNDSLKRSIISNRNILNTYINEQKIRTILSKASFSIHSGKLETSIKDLAIQVITDLELLTDTVAQEDPGVLESVDLGNEDTLSSVVSTVKDSHAEKGIFKTGWKKFNVMMAGGFRRGEQWVITALQHNYKSGLLDSLYVQFATLNVPILLDPTKKPLILLISFEDDIRVTLEFIYRYLYVNEYKTAPDMSILTVSEITSYISRKMSVNGFHTKIIRVNPAAWTYKDIFKTVYKLESEGFEIQALLIDYLSKLPTTGCIISGPTGTDVRDLFNRVRNFCTSKKILNITPHQTSTEANNLIRGGMKGFEYIEEISNKNYYSESKQIPQVVDGELYVGKFFANKQWGLYIGKGKHRLPIIVQDEDKKIMLPMPYVMVNGKKEPIPVLEDINDTDDTIATNSDTDFDF